MQRPKKGVIRTGQRRIGTTGARRCRVPVAPFLARSLREKWGFPSRVDCHAPKTPKTPPQPENLPHPCSTMSVRQFRPNLETHMRKLRDSLCALLVLLISSAPFALCQNSSLHGIDVTDLDRKAAPCDDFFQFANGTWRANNPIPASMTRWSKRWQAGESAKDRAARHSRNRLRRQERPQGQHRTNHRRLLRRLHGRVSSQRPRHGTDQAVVREDRCRPRHRRAATGYG